MSVKIDPAELSALRLIAQAAADFVDAMTKESPGEITGPFVRLQDVVVVLRQAAQLPKESPQERSK